MDFTPVVLAKGDAHRVASTPSQLVALQFDGWRIATTKPAPANVAWSSWEDSDTEGDEDARPTE